MDEMYADANFSDYAADVTSQSSVVPTSIHDLPMTSWSRNSTTFGATKEMTDPDLPHICGIPLGLKIAASSFLIVVSLVGGVGNVIMCLLVFKKPSMKSAINLLLASMAVSHALLAITCVPLSVMALVSDGWLLRSDVICRVTAFLNSLFTSESIFILLVISVDRYLIIVHRRDKLTPQTAKLLIVVTWMAAAILAFPPTVGWGVYANLAGWPKCMASEHRSKADLTYVVMATTTAFYLPMIVMMFSYLCIIRSVRHSMLQIQNYPVSISARCSIPDTRCSSVSEKVQSSSIAAAAAVAADTVSNSYISYRTINFDINFKTRAFKTIFLIFLVFFVCWFPYSVCILAWSVTNGVRSHCQAGTFLLCLGYSNCAVCPIAYKWRIGKYRETWEEYLPCSIITRDFWPNLRSRTQRKVNPSAAYECGGPLQDACVVTI